MKLKEFLEIVEKLNIYEIASLKEEEYFVELDDDVKVFDKNTVITKRWITRITGTAWESNPKQDIEDEPEFEALDEVLYNICPDISYLKYKKLLLLQESTETQEMYSDRVHTVVYIRLVRLYDELKFLKLIEE